MINYSKVYENTSKALNWLIDQCAVFNITPPDSLNTTGSKVKLGFGTKERKGSPVYYAHQTDAGNIFITFSTFKGGLYSETFSTSEGDGSYIIKPLPAKSAAKIAQEAQELLSKEEKFRQIEQIFESGVKSFDASKHSHYLLNSRIQGSTATLQDYASKINGLTYIADATSNSNYQKSISKSLFLPIKDIDGEVKGYQVIANEGKTKLFYGTIKGNFIVIGELPESNTSKDVMYVCEGVRTGLAVYAMTGQPVVCAMAAGFISDVVKSLKSKYPKLNLVIAADNDMFSKDGNTREYYQNAGLHYAHKAAYFHKLKVTAPFVDVPGVTDWYDILKINGIDDARNEFKTGIERADLNIAFSRRPKHDELTPGDRYMRPVELQPGITLIKSPIGTGKTTALQAIAAESSSFLYISHLQSLAHDASTRLGLSLYSDKSVDVGEASHLSICLNSLPKVIRDGAVKPYQYLAIDEIEQLLRRLVTKIDDKQKVLSTLEFLVKNCSHVVLLDANVGPLTKAWLRNLEVTYTQITNNYQIGANRKIFVYDDASGISDAANKELAKGGRVFLQLNSKKQARVFYLNLMATSHKKGLYISGDNSGDDKVKAFFANVNEQSKLYDFIVTTPSTNTGVSIDSIDGKPAFSFVGCVAKNGITTHTEVVQALGRVRDTQVVHLSIESRIMPKAQTREQIQARWIQAIDESKEFDYPETHINSIGEVASINDRYAELVTDVIQYRQRSHNYFEINILKELQSQGYEFASVDTQNKPLLKQARKVEKHDYLQRISNAKTIDQQEYEELQLKQRRKLIETESLEKHEITEFYKDFNDTIIELDDRGRGRRAIKLAERAFMTDDEVEHDIKKQAESKKLKADYIPIAALRDYTRLLLGLVIQLRLMGSYDQDSKPIQDFIAIMKRYRDNDAIRGVVNVPSDAELDKRPLKFVSEQLRRVFIKQKCVSKSHNSLRTYLVSLDAVVSLEKILLTRNPDKEQAILQVFNAAMPSV